MALGYRMVADIAGPGTVLETGTEGFLAWVRSKGPRVDVVADGVFLRTDRVEASSSSFASEDVSARKLTFTERTGGSRWTTTLILIEDGDGDHLMLDVDAPGVAPQQWVSVPRLAKELLSRTTASDGVVDITSRARTADTVPGLVSELINGSRRVPVIVASAPPGVELAQWQGFVDQFTAEAVGMASVVVIDRERSGQLLAELGPSLAVAPGTIRTFLPGMDLANPGEGLRHRFLSSRRLVEGVANPRSVARLVGLATRRLILSQPPPERFRTARRHFPTATARSTPIPTALASDVEAWARSVVLAVYGDSELVMDRLSHLSALVVDSELNRQHAEELLARAELLRDRTDDLELELAIARELVDDREIDLLELSEELAEANDRVRKLRALVTDPDAQQAAWDDLKQEDRTSLPADMTELLRRLAESDWVLYTGDSDVTLSLEEHDSGRWAGVAWTHILALEDYAKAKATAGFVGGLLDYVRNPPPGFRGLPRRAFAPNESESVLSNPRMREARCFPVPRSVSRDEVELFAAHTRIARHGQISPRMHLYDATNSIGKILVGYIGPHLETDGTN